MAKLPILERKINIILASTSVFRKSLLERLNIAFEILQPNTEESRVSGESIKAMATRLAEEKAKSVAASVEDSIIIGSDQTVDCDGRLLGKPGDFERAKQQLTDMSGKTVMFHTGLCVFNSSSQKKHIACVDSAVTFRQLQEEEIVRYLRTETPYQCAGSFKSEESGIALLEQIQTDDPTGLIGLPLIACSKFLRQEGIALP